MFKHMLLGLGAASLLVVVTAMPVQAAGINFGKDPGLSVPSVIVTRGGLEWVWASPCGVVQQNCDDGDLEPHHEFAIPTVDQWNASFNSLGTLESAFTFFNPAAVTVANPLGVDTVCAAAYFSVDWNHCDLGDLRAGNLWLSPLANPSWAASHLDSFAETFLVRVNGSVPDPNGAVPESSSLLLLGAGLLGLAVWRWKQTA